MTKDEALKMAYDWVNEYAPPEVVQACKEALEQPLTRDWKETIDERIAKDDGFKQALTQPAQEPVKQKVKVLYEKNGIQTCEILPTPLWQGNKEFVGLSDDEIAVIIGNGAFYELGDLEFARAIEQELKTKNGFSALKEKNT
jgi:hypothetical protein